VTLAGQTASSFAYDLPPGGHVVHHLTLDRSAGATVTVETAQLKLTPDSGQTAPVLQSLERREVGISSDGGAMILPRALPPSRNVTGFRLPVALSRRDSGVVLSNGSAAAVTVDLVLADADGAQQASASLGIAPGAQEVVWVGESFSGVASDFAGLLEGTSASGFDAVGVLRQVNGRGEEILAGFPVRDLTAGSDPDGLRRYVWAIDGDSWASEFWFMNGSSAERSADLAFVDASGRSLHLPMEASDRP
jgi:hypothetical protein